MRFTVSQTVRNSHGDHVDIPFAKDTDGLGVIHAVTAILTNLDDTTVPASVRTELVSINVTRTDIPRICWCGAPATYRQSVDRYVTPGAYELDVYGAPEWWLDVCDEHVTGSADRLPGAPCLVCNGTGYGRDGEASGCLSCGGSGVTRETGDRFGAGGR